MKAIKRITALALCALMLLGLLSGCGEKKQGDEKFVLNASVCNVIDSRPRDEHRHGCRQRFLRTL